MPLVLRHDTSVKAVSSEGRSPLVGLCNTQSVLRTVTNQDHITGRLNTKKSNKLNHSFSYNRYCQKRSVSNHHYNNILIG